MHLTIFLDKLQSLLTCFDTGDSENFTKQWLTHIPLFVRQEDARVQKAYFMVRVQFLARCWSLEGESTTGNNIPTLRGGGKGKKKHSNQLQREMTRFRKYLEEEGGDIAGTDRTLEKYPALLYVGNPKKHPSFIELFSGVGPVIRNARTGRGGEIFFLSSCFRSCFRSSCFRSSSSEPLYFWPSLFLFFSLLLSSSLFFSLLSSSSSLYFSLLLSSSSSLYFFFLSSKVVAIVGH